MVSLSQFKLSKLPSFLQLFTVKVKSCWSGYVEILILVDLRARFTADVAEELNTSI